MVKSRSNINIIFLIGLLFFGGFYPVLWNTVLFGQYAIHFSVFFLILLVILYFVYKPNLFIRNTSIVYTALVFILIIYYLLRLLIFDDIVHYRIFVIITAYISVILINTLIGGRVFMELLIKFQIIMIFASIIGVILFYTGILGPPETLNQNLYHGKVFLNYNFFIVKVNELSDFDPFFIRTGGFYDEPGSFAFVTLFLLIYNKLHLNNKFFERVLLFGGLITLSAAHIITVIIYSLFFYLNKNNLWFFIFVLLFFIGIYYLPIDQDWFTFFKNRSYDRIIDILKGTDESRDYNYSFEAFKYYFLTGGNLSDIIKRFPNIYSDTIWISLATHGIFGSLIYYSPFILILIKSVKTGLFSVYTKVILLLLINFIQRPDYIAPLYLFIFYFIWFEKNDNQEKIKNKEPALEV